MIYDPDGVRFEGEEPKVFRATSEQGNSTQRYAQRVEPDDEGH